MNDLPKPAVERKPLPRTGAHSGRIAAIQREDGYARGEPLPAWLCARVAAVRELVDPGAVNSAWDEAIGMGMRNG